jgi:transposase
MSRKKHNASFKAKVALETLKNDMTIAELSQKYNVHPTQINRWKADLLKKAEMIFRQGNKVDKADEVYVAALERKAGQLAIEVDFLKKNLNAYYKKTGL